MNRNELRILGGFISMDIYLAVTVCSSSLSIAHVPKA